MLLGDDAELERKSEKTMFIISQLHCDNLLGLIRNKSKKGKQYFSTSFRKVSPHAYLPAPTFPPFSLTVVTLTVPAATVVTFSCCLLFYNPPPPPPHSSVTRLIKEEGNFWNQCVFSPKMPEFCPEDSSEPPNFL